MESIFLLHEYIFCGKLNDLMDYIIRIHTIFGDCKGNIINVNEEKKRTKH